METRLTHSHVSTSDPKARRHPNSPVLKRSIRLAGNKASISLENQFWNCLREIAGSENIAVDALIERIDTASESFICGSIVRPRLF
ncbi:MAG: ribbon-helix-helix domain-containing protein [Pseudolabrys sp.]